MFREYDLTEKTERAKDKSTSYPSPLPPTQNVGGRGNYFERIIIINAGKTE
jgi:hypothetical protein